MKDLNWLIKELQEFKKKHGGTTPVQGYTLSHGPFELGVDFVADETDEDGDPVKGSKGHVGFFSHD